MDRWMNSHDALHRVSSSVTIFTCYGIIHLSPFTPTADASMLLHRQKPALPFEHLPSLL